MSHVDGKQQWVEEYYRRVDAMDVDGFLGMIAEESTLTLGNADPVVGRDRIAETFGGLLGVIRSSRHVLHGVHDLAGDLAAVEGDLGVVRQDGKELSVRFCAWFRIGEDGLAHEQRLYADFAPLFA